MASKLFDFVGCALTLGPTPSDKWRIFWRLTKNVRVRLRLASYHPADVYCLNTTYGRLHFRDNFGDITNLVKLIYHGEYQVMQLAQPGVILDVGANIGMAAVWFAYHNPSRPLCCFEPLPGNTELVRRNCPNATVVDAAVGSKPGNVTLQVDPDGIMASSIPNQWVTGEITCEVVTLDDYALAHDIRDVAILKIDAEGMENEILRGAARLLRDTSLVVLETHGYDRHQEALSILCDASFAIVTNRYAGATGFLLASRTLPQSRC